MPTIVIGIVLTATLGQSLPNLLAILLVSGWIAYSRVLRLQVRGLVRSEFVIAAHAMGAEPGRVVVRHVLPNILPTIVILLMQQIAAVMIWEASLTFLGLGLPFPTFPLGAWCAKARITSSMPGGWELLPARSSPSLSWGSTSRLIGCKFDSIPCWEGGSPVVPVPEAVILPRSSMFDRSVSRRSVLISSILAGGSFPLIVCPTIAQTPASVTQESIMIDTSIAPTTLDPALARSVFDWSIIHSIYDSILDLSDGGEILPLAAESFAQVDDRTFEVRPSRWHSYHDGSPVRAEAIERAVSYVQASEGPAARNFGVIERVEVIDDLTAHIVTAEPRRGCRRNSRSGWCSIRRVPRTPSRPAPVGSGPFRFVSRVILACRSNWNATTTISPGARRVWRSPNAVTYRFVSGSFDPDR